MIRASISVLAFASLFIVPANAQGVADEPAAPAEWTPELLLQVKRVSNVRISPDGSMATYEISEPRMTEEKSDYLTHIWLVDLEEGRAIQLTRGEESCSGAQWSPDSAWIAFTSSRGMEKNNLFRISARGGEAERLTDVKTGVGGFEWSPDGAHIAFTMSDEPSEEEEKEQKEKNDARVVDEDLKMTHLHLVPVEADADGEREVRRLTEGDFNIGGNASQFDWSPDGRVIVFSHTKSPKVDDWLSSDISQVNVESGEVVSLIATGAAESQPHFSPDGEFLAYTASDDPPVWASSSGVYVRELDSGETLNLVRTPDERPSILGWSSDLFGVYVTDSAGTRSQVYQLPLRARSGPLPVGAPLVLSSMDLNRTGTHFGFAMESSDIPPQPYIASADDFAPRPIANVQTIPDLPIPEARVIRWTSTDGTEIEGILTYPIDYEPGARVPLLLIIHGGPAGVFRETFVARASPYPIAIFAQRGYATLRCNPRGSSGYGKDFRFANRSDWGGGDYQDIMAGVDHVIELGVADPARMGLMGWSYGGYMTSWVITQTDRFAAASVGAGVTNLVSFTGTADIPSFIPSYFEGETWETGERWLERSAMSHVHNVSTPALIQHGEEDARVPVSQGYEFYNALTRRGVPVKMVVYPRQPHGIREPRLLIDAHEPQPRLVRSMDQGRVGGGR